MLKIDGQNDGFGPPKASQNDPKIGPKSDQKSMQKTKRKKNRSKTKIGPLKTQKVLKFYWFFHYFWCLGGPIFDLCWLFFRFVFCIDFWSFFGPILGSFWEAFGRLWEVQISHFWHRFFDDFCMSFKIAPRAAKSGPGAAKSGPRASQEAQKVLQEVPREPQERQK